MAKVSFIIKMEGITKGIGRTTRWMAMGSYTIRVANLPMRKIGLKTSFMEFLKFTMITQ